MLINAIIVDDEDHARKYLYFLIEQHCTNVKIKGIASSVADARMLLQTNKIDLVFLDIAMPVEDGFSLLPDLDKHVTSVIFTTAFNHYAIRAIRASALDYLLKPIDILELQNAVARVSELKFMDISNKDHSANNEVLFNSLQENMNDMRKIRKINLPHATGFHVLDIDHILYVTADSNYSIFHTTDRQKILVSKHLKEYESILDDRQFCRIHKSTLINLRHLINYSNKNGLWAKMTDQSVHSVSRRKSPVFMEAVKEMFKK